MIVKEEIDYLTEDRDRYKELFHQAVKNRDEFVALADTKQKQWETLSRNYDMLYDEKVELQRQVNELTEQRDVFKRLFESVNTSNFSTNSIIETLNSFYREQAEHLAGLKIEQAVKDTAKEILQEVVKLRKEEHGIYYSAYDYAIEISKRIRKKYGVEVE